MSGEAHALAAFALALVATLVATPVAIAVATRSNFHDRPLGYKRHAAPTPYLGGAAVLCGFLLASFTIGGELLRLAPIVASAAVLWVLGTLDDRRSLPPGPRLAVEAALAIVLWASGLGWSLFEADGLNLALTILWVVGLVNAFNLMDNMDGAAATVGAVTAVATGAMALIHGDPGIAVLCGALAGACLGFLPYNLAGPARIFLGDGGSLPVGFVIAASIMALRAGGELGWAPLLAAVLLAGLPTVDTALVMISRRRAAVPLFTGARDHLTHRLVTRLGSPRTVALTLGAVQAVLGAVAVGVVELGDRSIVAAWTVWFVAGAATVATLESKGWAPVRERPAEVATEQRPPAPRARPLALVEGAVIVFITVACGLSPFLYGFYDVSVWGPIALFLLAALFGMVVARPVVPRPAALTALSGVVVLWLWSLLSSSWAESADQAITESNRWLFYAALLGILILLLRNDRLGALLLGSATAAVLGLAGYLAAALLVGNGPDLFLGGRLNEPLGYVNGEAGYLLLGFWPLVAAAERVRSHALSGAALAGASLLAGIVLLTQTRAVVPAFVVTALVLLLVVPGRTQRAWALIFVLAAVSAAAGPLVDVYESAIDDQVGASGLRQAVAVLLISAALAGIAWGYARAWASRVGGTPASATLRRISAAGATGVALAGCATALAAVGNPAPKVKREAKAFVELHATSKPTNRLTSGAGNRYDYWRVAAREFRDEPLRGVGAGNYDRTYFLDRRTAENIRQPHSIELQALAELGLVGGGALALLLVGLLAGFWRRVARARESLSERALAVAGGGVFLTWLIHTSVDWLHLIPGVTGIALCAAAVLVGPWQPGSPGRRSVRRTVIAACAVLVVFGAVVVGRSALAEHERSQARELVAKDPTEAIRKANDSLELNDEALPTYYVKAAAYARLDRYESARATLAEAARREPHDFVPWALLGDLAVRRGDLERAHLDYARASSLNPRDESLRRLERDPPSAAAR